MDRQKTLVVKFGTAMLMRDGAIRQGTFRGFAEQVNQLMGAAKPTFVVLVTSGAIQMGWEAFQKNPLFSETACLLPDSLGGCGRKEKKLLAATGQRHLMNAWGDAFATYGREVAQELVTHANWENEGERKSVQENLQMCKERRIVPVMNENDPVSDIEIDLMERSISENDILAAYVAGLVNADGILFLTESGGVRTYDRSQRGRVIRQISLEELDEVSVKHGSANGRGGMEKKFDAIRFSAEKNPTMRIVVAGRQKDVIVHFAKGNPVGTRIITGGK